MLSRFSVRSLLSGIGALAVLAVTVGTTTLLTQSPASAASGTVSGIVYRDWNYNGSTTDRYATTFSTPSNYIDNRMWSEGWWNGQTTPVSDNPSYPAYLRNQEPGEPGISIVVTDTAGAQWTGTTGANGTFSVSVPSAATTAVRVEMVIPSSKPYLVVGAKGARSSGNVRFVTLGSTSTNLYFSVSNPSEYCKHDSSSALRVITPCFKFGDQKSSTPKSVLESVPYDSPTSAYTTSPPQVSEATANQIGTTYGLAWDPYRQNLFAAAYMRRHAGFGPYGTGAIYKVAGPGTGAKSVTVWADLNALFGAGTAGADPHPTGAAGCSGTSVYSPAVHAGPITACENAWGHDVASYDKVGKVSLGDMDISEDGANLFVVNMADKKLYKMSSTVSPATSADVTTMTIPLAASGTGGTYKCAAADSRPMAVTIHDGVGYLGVICSQESGASVSDSRGYIYKFDPTAMTATAAPVLGFRWDGAKTSAGVSFTNNSAWSSTWVNATAYGSDWPHEHSVQLIISSIVFDDNDMLVGMRNRHHDQISQWTFNLDESNTTYRTNPSVLDGGVIVRSCPTATGWAAEGDSASGFAESNCTGGYQTNWGVGSNTMYGTKSLFDTWPQYISQGSMVLLQGSQSRRAELYSSSNTSLNGGKMLLTYGDPEGTWYSGGIGSMSPTYGWNLNGGATGATTFTGTDASFDNLYAEPGYSDSTVPPSTMGKTNGLGDLEVLCLYAPIDIGDRVWRDNNSNGLQDAGEPGLDDVTVRLMQGAGVLATAETDSNGNYLFTSRSGTNTSSTIFGVSNLKPGQNDLYVKVDTTDGSIPSGFHIATKTVGSNGRIDSDGQADGGTAMFNIVTSYSQSLDFDFGFCSAASCTAGEIYAIGDKVWSDTNGNDVLDGGELGGSGITVELLDASSGTVLASTLVNATTGKYAFDGLGAGSYKVRFSGLVAGDVWVAKGAGSDRAVDSDVDTVTGTTATIVLDSTNTNLRAPVAGDGVSRATKIDPTIDAGKRTTAAVVSSTVCLTPT
jgi:hypothetical protein